VVASIFGCGSHGLETLRILSGSGAKQTHSEQMAKAVEVVRNHEDGTGERLVPLARVEEWNLRRDRGLYSHVGSRTFTRTNFKTGGCSDTSRLVKESLRVKARSGGRRAHSNSDGQLAQFSSEKP